MRINVALQVIRGTISVQLSNCHIGQKYKRTDRQIGQIDGRTDGHIGQMDGGSDGHIGQLDGGTDGHIGQIDRICRDKGQTQNK